MIPKRRSLSEHSAAAKIEIGLRIDANLTRVETTDSCPQLEVREICGSVVRLEQAITASPKVARRVTFHEKPLHLKNGDDEGRNWGLSQRHSTRWLLIAGLTVVATILLSLILLPRINARNAPRIEPERGVLRVEIEDEIGGMDAINLLLTKQPEALKIFRAYAQASHIDEILPLLRGGTSLEETLHKHWHPLDPSKSWSPTTTPSWEVLELAGQACGLLQGEFPDHSQFSAYFTQTGNHPKLDWKATTAYGTASFKELVQNQGDASEIRGEISKAEFYNAAWPETDYRCYRLISPDGETVIWGYTRRGEATEHAIASLLDKGEIVKEAQNSHKITLRLERGPTAAQANQWLIGEMLHIDWVTP